MAMFIHFFENLDFLYNFFYSFKEINNLVFFIINFKLFYSCSCGGGGGFFMTRYIIFLILVEIFFRKSREFRFCLLIF
jgi:hypothetical protein